jgi:hypothetical protein
VPISHPKYVSLMAHVGDSGLLPGQRELDQFAVGRRSSVKVLEDARVGISAGGFGSRGPGTPSGEPPVRHGRVQEWRRR